MAVLFFVFLLYLSLLISKLVTPLVNFFYLKFNKDSQSAKLTQPIPDFPGDFPKPCSSPGSFLLVLLLPISASPFCQCFSSSNLLLISHSTCEKSRLSDSTSSIHQYHLSRAEKLLSMPVGRGGQQQQQRCVCVCVGGAQQHTLTLRGV